ncbi:sigma-70 family RNA polymerase sigma factor [Paenibacillus hodogayensis]|uniref:Sigma-70 family RNA polymerase sigma factor n=1 Tax=Paenibacillus hodogayensis TaxID=279208 RepID=A0ABV5VW29_9BACL
MALRELMALYGDYLLRTSYLLLKDRQAAEEAVQDTFVTAFYKIGQLQDPDKIKSWLTRIVVNRCRMSRRSWSWQRLLALARPESAAELPDRTQNGPEEKLLLEWRDRRLTDAVRRLSYPYREVIALFYFNELGIGEMSELLAINGNTIKSRLARARSQLKRILEKEANEDER